MPTISLPQRQRSVKAEQNSSEPITASDIEVTQSSGNIFADLGFPNPEEAEAKALISIQIERVIAQKGLTQTAAAQQMGLTEPKAADLIRGSLRSFTTDQLQHCLAALQQNSE